MDAFNELDQESIYTRFFQNKKSLTDTELKRVTEPDFENDVVLVVTTGPEGAETIIGGGGGRYAAYVSQKGIRCAEVAFTVEEDYHGHGIASNLMRKLVSIAREKGVSQFQAEVLSQNKSMLKVFASCGLPKQKNQESEVIHVTSSLDDENFT